MKRNLFKNQKVERYSLGKILQRKDFNSIFHKNFKEPKFHISPTLNISKNFEKEIFLLKTIKRENSSNLSKQIKNFEFLRKTKKNNLSQQKKNKFSFKKNSEFFESIFKVSPKSSRQIFGLLKFKNQNLKKDKNRSDFLNITNQIFKTHH